jgi:hypothetical protein
MDLWRLLREPRLSLCQGRRRRRLQAADESDRRVSKTPRSSLVVALTNLSVPTPALSKLARLALPLSALGSKRPGLSGPSRGKLAVGREGVDGPAADDAPEWMSAPVELVEEPGTSPADNEGAGPRRESTSESTSRRDGRAGEPRMGWDKGARGSRSAPALVELGPRSHEPRRRRRAPSRIIPRFVSSRA